MQKVDWSLGPKSGELNQGDPKLLSERLGQSAGISSGMASRSGILAQGARRQPSGGQQGRVITTYPYAGAG